MSSTTAAAPAVLSSINNHEAYLTDGIPSASSLSPNPLTQFTTWFNDAVTHPVVEPEAMTISTVSLPKGIPSTRVVLLKKVDGRGFVFYTNYESRKGRELFRDPETNEGGYISAVFYWHALHRSVRVVGRAEKISEAETKEYYHSRPIGSQVGAWASKQSTVLTGREELEKNVVAIEAEFGVVDGKLVNGGEGLPVPPFWGGVRIVPFEVEFWMGRDSRLHDRFRYTREEEKEEEVEGWEVVRLSP